ncbi:MAG: RNA polymerase sigma factor [Myxococcales bacterium]|nr:RNA polymerase sigma factor [Myxococcales bacterium]
MHASPAPAEPPDLHQIYAAHVGHVWRTLRRLGVAARDLEDATHEVFVVVHRRLPDFDPERPIKPWLTGIAWRVAADERRRARHHRERLGDDVGLGEPAAQPDPEQLLAARQARDLVAQALDTLDLDRRVVFVMADIDQASGPEIAAALGLPLNTVYSRLRVARERFAAAVRRIRLTEGAP